MKDAYKLLRQKEADLERVRHELESLQLAASLLSSDTPSNDVTTSQEMSAEKKLDLLNESRATGTDDLLSSMIPVSRPSFWKTLKRRK